MVSLVVVETVTVQVDHQVVVVIVVAAARIARVATGEVQRDEHS